MKINKIADHKRRLDRGRIYFSYIQVLATTAILVKVFKVDAWWAYLLGAALVFAVCYVLGYMDDKKKVLANEQNSYNKENPFVQKVLSDLEYIKNKLNQL